MDIRIKEKLKNQQGSSLAFVLIIGMAIMIMVASLLVVANGNFTFTQETLESRQAYIDAKSVIEFGKIEINDRMTKLKNKNAELEGYYNEYKNGDNSTQLVQKINTAKNERDALVVALTNPFMIYGNPDDVTGTLTTEAPDAVNAAKIVKLGELSFDNINYQFKIETQGLRRKLDYKVKFIYNSSMSEPVTGGNREVNLDLPSGKFCFTKINAKKNYKEDDKGKDDPVSCVITADGDGHNTKYYSDIKTLKVNAAVLNLEIGKDEGSSDKFTWNDKQKLDIVAQNICVTDPIPTRGVAEASFNITATGELRFKDNYEQKNEDVSSANYKKNTLTATDMVFLGNLFIDEKSYIEIKDCVNLWVEGNIIIKTEDKALINKISAANIFVKGDIIVSDNSIVEWNYTNFWHKGLKTNKYPNSGTSAGGSVVVTPGKTELVNEMYY